MSHHSLSFLTIGVDTICMITQYLPREDLRAFMQLNRSCAQIVEQVHSSHYQLPLPSFDREEFNINNYRKWRSARSFLVITSPEQFLAYSRSRILTHATDIELRLDAYCRYPTSAPASVMTAWSFWLNPKVTTTYLSKAMEKWLVDIRASIRRFEYVRSLRLWFRPSGSDVGGDCFCASETYNPFASWFMKFAELCLEIWSPGLISFEVEMDSWYKCFDRCTQMFKQLPHLPSLQHLALCFPAHKIASTDQPFVEVAYTIPESLLTFQFESVACSLFVFEGDRERSTQTQTAENTRGNVPRSTNASQVIWTRSCPVSMLCDVYQYLADMNQLQTVGVQQLNQPRVYTHTRCPIVSLQRYQLRTFIIDPSRWSSIVSVEERQAAMKRRLEWMVEHFTAASGRSHSNQPCLAAAEEVAAPVSSLELLALQDQFGDPKRSFTCDHSSMDDAPFTIDYASHFHRLRHQLRMFTFHTTTKSLTRSSTGPFVGVSCNGCQVFPIPDENWSCTVCINFNLCQQCHPDGKIVEGRQHDRTHPMTQIHERYAPTTRPLPLPISLVPMDVVDEFTIKHLQWPRLECLTLRSPLWEISLDCGQRPPWTHETWMALERTLPKLESFRVSVGILPLGVEPLSGILLKIKYLDLFDTKSRLAPQTISVTRDYLFSSLTTVVTQLRQLESLSLNLNCFGPDKFGSLFIDCILPIVLSSSNLRSFSTNGGGIDLNQSHEQLEGFESTYQSHLFEFYALWQLLQPSFEPPLDYTSIRTFFYPLLPSHSHPSYDMRFLHGFNEVDLDRPQSRSWKSRFQGWIKPKQFKHEQEVKRLQQIHTRTILFHDILTRLRTRMVQLYQQHPQLTFQPRSFTLQLTFVSDLFPTPFFPM